MTAESAAPASGPPEGITEAADALGTLWATFQLYPEPLSQPIFTRAVEELRTAPFYPFQLEVGPGVLLWHRMELPVRRDGVERFAKALFLHDVAAMNLSAPPTAEEVLACFRVADMEGQDLAASGGPRAALAAHGIESIELIARTLLMEAAGPIDDAEIEARDPELAALLDIVDEPEAFAAELLAAAGADAGHAAAIFVDHFRSLYGRIAAEDYGARESVVRFFVEAVFCLPAGYRPSLLSRLLEQKDDNEVRTLLDQFSGHDLSELSQGLDPDGMERLLEYARLSTDGVDGRPEELLGLLQPAGLVEGARRAVAQRVEQLLDGKDSGSTIGEAFHNLRSQLSAELLGPDIGTGLLRRIIRVEDREVRLRRVLRIWTGRVAAYIRGGDLEAAGAWLAAVLEDPPYPPKYAGQVKQALIDLASPQLLDALVRLLAEDGETSSVERLLKAWGPAVSERLVEQLAEEESPVRRRVLMDFLTIVGRMDPAPLLPYLADERWFVVRNLAAVLGRTGRPEVGVRLKPMAAHSDHRVRVETLRALVPLLGDAATEPLLEALVDPHVRVRQASLTLLRASTDQRVDAGLAEALESPRLGSAERRQVAALMADRGSEVGRDALRRHAGRRLALTASQRQNREVAKQVLKRRAV